MPKKLAISIRGNEGGNTTFTKVTKPQLNGGKMSISIVSLPMTNSRILYLGNGRRLFAISELSNQIPNAYIGNVFNVNTHSLIQSINTNDEFWGNSRFLDGPVYDIFIYNEPCCLIRSNHLAGHYQTSFMFYTAEGRGVAHWAAERMAHTVVANHLLTINAEKRILLWKGSSAIHAATFECDDFHSMLELKGLAVSDNQITLVLDNEKFIFLRRNI